MANIADLLKQILNARFGKDVRQSIHDAIQTCYEDGKAGSTDLTARQQIEEVSSKVDSAEQDITNLSAKVGTATLTTTAKNLCGAINEHETNIVNLDTKVGSATLSTTSKNLSGAVNELKNNIDNMYFQVGDNFATASSILYSGAMTSASSIYVTVNLGKPIRSNTTPSITGLSRLVIRGSKGLMADYSNIVVNGEIASSDFESITVSGFSREQGIILFNVKKKADFSNALSNSSLSAQFAATIKFI